MMQPCNYNEAWGLLTTSGKNPKKIVLSEGKYDQSKVSPNNFKSFSSCKNQELNYNIIPDAIDKKNDRPSMDCSQCLIHLMTCRYCQSKIQEFSRVCQSFSPSNNSLNYEPTIPFFSGQNSNENDIMKSFRNINNNNNKNNEILLYILIGLLFGYIISQILSKK
jgi:hypothetical protein